MVHLPSTHVCEDACMLLPAQWIPTTVVWWAVVFEVAALREPAASAEHCKVARSAVPRE